MDASVVIISVVGRILKMASKIPTSHTPFGTSLVESSPLECGQDS